MSLLRIVLSRYATDPAGSFAFACRSRATRYLPFSPVRRALALARLRKWIATFPIYVLLGRLTILRLGLSFCSPNRRGKIWKRSPPIFMGFEYVYGTTRNMRHLFFFYMCFLAHIRVEATPRRTFNEINVYLNFLIMFLLAYREKML